MSEEAEQIVREINPDLAERYRMEVDCIKEQNMRVDKQQIANPCWSSRPAILG